MHVRLTLYTVYILRSTVFFWRFWEAIRTCYPLTEPGSQSTQASDQGLFGMQIRPVVSWSETIRTGSEPFFSKEKHHQDKKRTHFMTFLTFFLTEKPL